MGKHNSEGDGCCCECQYQLIDLSHPNTDGGSLANQRGWICNAPEFTEVRVGKVYKQANSGWCEHGLCEMFDPRLDCGPGKIRANGLPDLAG